jgi:large subunit ribosomal protein L18
MANKSLKKELSRERRRKSFAKKFRFSKGKLRLVVYRSNKHIYAQVVDDLGAKTIVAASTKSKEISAEISGAKKVDQAKAVGKQIAKLAIDQKVETVVFDRAGYLYHGRVKALAEGAREGGLKF